MSIDFKALTARFYPEEIEWRIGQSGKNANGFWSKAFAYIDNRAILKRLDDVLGPENWQDRVEPGPDGAVCGIGIKVDGEWVWKWDGAERTDFEPFKGALSGAEKRAASKWGIGRYLYALPEGWCECSPTAKDGWNFAKTKDGERFWWIPPTLPDWALPEGDASKPSPAASKPTQQTFIEPEPAKPAPASQQAANKKFPERACPECGETFAVRSVRKDLLKPGDAPYYCWKKLEKPDGSGVRGCGAKWGNEQENPFGETQTSQPRKQEQKEQPLSHKDNIAGWARLILDAPILDGMPDGESPLDKAILTIKKAIVEKRLSTQHAYEVLKTGFESCETKGQFENMEASAMPVINACFDPPMSDKLRLSFGELIAQTDGRLSAPAGAGIIPF